MRRLLFVLWGSGITVGALWIRFAVPQARSPALAALVACEPFHVFAHTVLYATMAWLAALAVPLAWVVPAVLGLGVVQEAAQVLGGRGPGWPEAFDLAVDGAAALTVVLALRLTRSFARRSR